MTDVADAVRDGTAEAIDLGRARCFALLGALLARPPAAHLLGQVATVTGDDTPVGEALGALAEAAAEADEDRVEREFHHLFVGVGRGEMLPYGSYYQTGFLHERPLARLRGEMQDLGIVRADGVVEPEDHIAQLCEMMAGLATGAFPSDPERQRRFFERHVASWAPRFFSDLETAKAARFYRAVGRFGRVVMDVERDAYALGDG
jgi:TorA maturation chaperone TorD